MKSKDWPGVGDGAHQRKEHIRQVCLETACHKHRGSSNTQGVGLSQQGGCMVHPGKSSWHSFQSRRKRDEKPHIREVLSTSTTQLPTESRAPSSGSSP